MTTTPEQTESAENARFEPAHQSVLIWDSISHMMNETAEQAARDMLERMGIEGIQGITTVDLVELTNLIAASKKATPAPAWEPLTPERLEKLKNEPTGTRYWLACYPLACKQMESGPVMGVSNRLTGCVYFDSGDEIYEPEQVSHIMPFTTPEMPK